MGIERFKELPVPGSVAIGAATDIGRLTDKTVQFIGTFVATIDIEGSLDPAGVEYGVIATVTAPGIVQIPGTYQTIRMNTTSFTSGAPLAYLGARDDRTR